MKDLVIKHNGKLTNYLIRSAIEIGWGSDEFAAEFNACKAELQNKPKLDDIPDWVNWIVQNPDGQWVGYSEKPELDNPLNISRRCMFFTKGTVLSNWQDTLEQVREPAPKGKVLNTEGLHPAKIQQLYIVGNDSVTLCDIWFTRPHNKHLLLKRVVVKGIRKGNIFYDEKSANEEYQRRLNIDFSKAIKAVQALNEALKPFKPLPWAAEAPTTEGWYVIRDTTLDEPVPTVVQVIDLGLRQSAVLTETGFCSISCYKNYEWLKL